ncbi:alcohol dehydrogenase catalytic domain-containing protein [Streptomyces sp. PKU-EA00015]|uniref:alcohol dehydrogenase catalytic domain-containing protein n=1 Tax=Streptomyces sp. PKU-EA00015 TaxID=2748326 RepID=UPI0015A0D404|nr:alcohol dehydrogenase catalytic domain-containing protein [Streptomyces sp. PKU-EA00015]NWF24738.1 alcohol dehydrogenase catalytic domain-containing protein [Streptomyces sp. PKU-EA00015]
MRALVFEAFGQELSVREVPNPDPSPAGAVIKVEAAGLCRSDWYGWQGHDQDIRCLPHVPGHELAGVVEAVGSQVSRWRPGDRVTVPFVCACGTCGACAAGEQQVCERQTQPGFHHWGSFAEYAAVDYADVNLVRLPTAMEFTAAAGLGCQFATAFRAVVQVGAVRPGEWVVVYGCDGIGLSAVMIAATSGARVVAVDSSGEALALAERLGAAAVHRMPASGEAPGNARGVPEAVDEVAAAVRDITGGGAHLSIDAMGQAFSTELGIGSLRRRGRHVQVRAAGGLTGLSMNRVLAYELVVSGSHGMAAHAYPAMMDLATAGILRPDLLITRTVGLDKAGLALAEIGTVPGITVILPHG